MISVALYKSSTYSVRLAALALSLQLGLLGVACESGPKEGEEATYYAAQLNGAETTDADMQAAVLKLQELKDPASLPALHQYLSGSDGRVKSAVVLLVSNLGNKDSVPALLSAIDYKARPTADKASKQATAANEAVAKALAKFSSKADPKTVEALTKLADSSHLETQLAAIVALGELQIPEAVDDLVDIAEGHTNNFMVKNAAKALGNIGDAKAIPALVRLLFVERDGVSFYAEASYSLFQIGKEALPALRQVYKNNFEKIRDLHIEPGVQKAKALQVLSDIGSDDATRKFCSEAAAIPPNDTANSLARVYGQQCVGRLGVKSAASRLKQGWDELDQSISEHALNALVQLGQKGVAGELAQMTSFEGFVKQCMKLDRRNKREQCEKGSTQVRGPRVLALSRIGPGSLLESFQKMVKEEKDPKLKKKIELGVSRIQAAKDCDGKGLACWMEKLKHANPQHRERAAYELAWDGGPEAQKGLVSALGDEDNETRYAAILGVWRTLPKEAKSRIEHILKSEKGKTQFVRINEDLKRLLIKVERGY